LTPSESRHQWLEKNKDKVRACYKKWRQENPDYARKWRKEHIEQSRASANKSAARPKAKMKRNAKRLWDMYRITPEEQMAIKKFQEEHPMYKLLLGKHNGTDHNHKTGLIRGIMDWRINVAYGLLEKIQNVNLSALLQALIVFHEHPPAELVLGEKRFGLLGIAKYKKKMIYGPPL